MSRQQFVGIRSGSRGAFHLGLIRHELIFTFYGFIMPMPVGQWRSYQNVYQVCHGATGLGQRLDADYLVLCAEERILCALGAATRGGHGSAYARAAIRGEARTNTCKSANVVTGYRVKIGSALTASRPPHAFDAKIFVLGPVKGREPAPEHYRAEETVAARSSGTSV